jgi:DNA-binding beta-propeller fold protein YncE
LLLRVKVVFESSEESFEQSLFGQLNEKYSCKYEKTRSNKCQKITQSKYLFSLAKNQKRNQILITDTEDNSLKVYDSANNKCIRTIKANQLYISKLSAVCVNAVNNNVYISDQANKKILVFDENFKYVRQFGDASNIKTPDSMIIDNETGTFLTLHKLLEHQLHA